MWVWGWEPQGLCRNPGLIVPELRPLLDLMYKGKEKLLEGERGLSIAGCLERSSDLELKVIASPKLASFSPIPPSLLLESSVGNLLETRG